MSRRILIVDDDPVQLRLLTAVLLKLGHRPLAVASGQAALQQLSGDGAQTIAAMVLDLVMPAMDGLAVLDTMRRQGVRVPVIVLTAQGSIEVAVSAMRAGAFDFAVKPVAPDRLGKLIENALKVGSVEAGRAPHGHKAAAEAGVGDFVGQSAAMERVLRLARKAATAEIPVLIEGESGVGKELVARAVHAGSPRNDQPFVTVNCGAIPENLVESILFGHEKGSFTGATERHVGKFAEADGGTLFLDEVGDLPISAQVKLLRAVQDGEIDPVGGRATLQVDVRIISATHRDILQMVKDGEFREDLFYRLHVFPIHVPALRMRRGDIPHLVRHFLGRACRQAGRNVAGLTAEALELLTACDWPGNIRQLENAILRAVVLADGDTLTVDEFPQIRALVEGIDAVRKEIAAPPMADEEIIASFAQALAEPDQDAAGPASLLAALDEVGEVRSLAGVEEDLIRFAISHYGGQMSEVARRLGIGRSTLYRKLKEFGIEVEKSGERIAS
ncbi:response regulator [Chelativorans sp. ZYF759]|uniref:sigma-54-dependent transcriptional regulator n=1 Tax=Chelativorans sp. ZYF759 TaxID=2692213 RepID=UPI00145C9D86|nr:sigma-54 dependent transcriptional regulator [Chelativorans sp. ZYF759]NMG40286.1 response regulator [Chelativorans sp. ZYF759]